MGGIDDIGGSLLARGEYRDTKAYKTSPAQQKSPQLIERMSCGLS